MENKFKREDLYIVGLRFYDKDHGKDGALVFSDNLSYLIVTKSKVEGNNNYYNVFDKKETYPLFKRTNYANYRSNGEAYGTKMELVSDGGFLETGPCWLVQEQLPEELGDEVSLKTLEDLVLKSDKYFKDREIIAKKRNIIKGLKTHYKDLENKRIMDKFFDEQYKELNNENNKKLVK